MEGFADGVLQIREVYAGENDEDGEAWRADDPYVSSVRVEIVYGLVQVTVREGYGLHFDLGELLAVAATASPLVAGERLRDAVVEAQI